MAPGDNIEILALLENNYPREEFLGFSSNQMHTLLYDVNGEDSPVRYHDNIDDEALDQVPLFRTIEEYLKILQREQQIKLTKLGALPKKVLVEVYEKRLLPDVMIEKLGYKIHREENLITLMSARLTAETIGLVKRANGKLTLTKKGAKLLDPAQRVELFKEFFNGYTDKFLWAFNDAYEEQHAGQLGWAFSLFMLHKFGDEFRQVKFYSDKYLNAFPSFLAAFDRGRGREEDDFRRCYCVRTFERFFMWFGFVQLERDQTSIVSDNDKYRRKAVVEKLFKFEEN